MKTYNLLKNDPCNSHHHISLSWHLELIIFFLMKCLFQIFLDISKLLLFLTSDKLKESSFRKQKQQQNMDEMPMDFATVTF